MSESPSTMKALTLQKTQGEFKAGPSCYHPIKLEDLPIPIAEKGQVLIKVIAVAFQHRDLFIRQNLYPGMIFSTPEKPSIFGSDAVGIVLSRDHPLYNQHVLVAPAVGWSESPLGPDVPKQPFGILGCVKQTDGRGTFGEYIVVGQDDLEPCPQHFLQRGLEGFSEAAATPLGGLTAFRAVFTKAKVEKGQNVLITGIGGGVAITALQFCVAKGANVWVTSGTEDKIETAKKYGAKGGVNYKSGSWAKELGGQLPKDRAFLDCVIDSGGGNIANSVSRILKDGGIISCYGSTTGQDVPIGMGFILKNQEFRGATMGSRAEFKQMVKFVAENQIRPVVFKILPSLEQAEEGFQIMKNGHQFGKIVIQVEKKESGKL